MTVSKKQRRILYFYRTQEDRPKLTDRRFACPVGKTSDVYKLSAEISAIAPSVVFAAAGVIAPVTWKRLQAKHRDVKFITQGGRFVAGPDRERAGLTFVERGTESIPTCAPVHNLVFVTSFFNPHGGRRRVEIFPKFSAALREQGAKLFTIEGILDGSAGQVVADVRVRIDPEAVMWHKESLLQIAIDRLPDRYDAVCWIDSDVIYQTTDIVDRIVDSLQSYATVQPWSEIQYLGPDGEPVDNVWRTSMAKHNLGRALPSADSRDSFPGMAWAARRETLAKVGGMYTRCITGAGDVAWSAAAWNDADVIQVRGWPPALREDVRRWGAAVACETGGRVGLVDARVKHLFHGHRQHRQYCSRHAVLDAVGFDPQLHLETASNGTLRWSAAAPPELRRAVAEYMHNRKEDE